MAAEAAFVTSPLRILVVEDEPLTAEILCRYLDRAGYETAAESNGKRAVAQASTWRPSLVVLDVMLPGLNGLDVLRQLRRGTGPRVPVILLTAKGEEADRIRGLELGADDYVVKPFFPAEVVARVGAVLRRELSSDEQPGPPLAFDGLEIDPAARSVRVEGRDVALTQREFDLLLFMATRPGHAFTREQLMDAVWRFSFYSETTTVTVHIRRLRTKIEPDPARPRYVETVWGVGYRFRP